MKRSFGGHCEYRDEEIINAYLHAPLGISDIPNGGYDGRKKTPVLAGSEDGYLRGWTLKLSQGQRASQSPETLLRRCDGKQPWCHRGRKRKMGENISGASCPTGEGKLWEEIFEHSRESKDPVEAWKQHVKILRRR